MLAIGTALAEVAAAGMARVKTWLLKIVLVQHLILVRHLVLVQHIVIFQLVEFVHISDTISTSSGEKASSLDPGDFTAPLSADVLFL